MASPVSGQDWKTIIAECRSPKLTDRAEAMLERFYDLWHAKNESMEARGRHLGEPAGPVLIHPDKGILFSRGASADQCYAAEDIAQVLRKASPHPGAAREQFILPARAMVAMPGLPSRRNQLADLDHVFKASVLNVHTPTSPFTEAFGANANDPAQPGSNSRPVAFRSGLDLRPAFAGVSGASAPSVNNIVDFVEAKKQITEPAASPVAPAAPAARPGELRLAA